MPVWSKDVQYGAAAGFVIIIGIVAIQFGFSAKLVLALLAGVGILFCASLFEGLPRAAMLGAGAILLLLVVYDLATSCDSACQQTRAEVAQQRAAQEQARLEAERRQQLAQTPEIQYCNGRKVEWHFGTEEPNKPFNPAGQCIGYIWYSDHCIFIKRAGQNERLGPFCAGGEGRSVTLVNGTKAMALPADGEYVWSADTPFDGYIQLNPPRY
jgi:hypothetical protein